MCTAITLQSPDGDVLFGRTMDFSYPISPSFFAVFKGHTWSNALRTHRIQNRYSFLGTGQDLPPVRFADGVNEAGFAAAALYFPGFAQYDAPEADGGAPTIASTELVGFLLGLCASVEEAVSLLSALRIVGLEDPVTHSVAPLHWILTDRSGACKVVEKTAAGLEILDNPIGVLTNSPGLPWHLANLRNYLHLSPAQQNSAHWGPLMLTPFGQGAGALGLPGDFTPPSRFVRAAYLKAHAAVPAGGAEAVVPFFHLLENVSIPKGIVVTDRGESDYTQYAICMDLSAPACFFKTYDNPQLRAVPLPPDPGDGRVTALGPLESPMALLQAPPTRRQS